MRIERIERSDDPRIAVYRTIRDAELVRRTGLFVAEGRLVVGRLLAARRYDLHSVLVTDTTLRGLEPALAHCDADAPIYVCAQSCADEIVGYHVHRGCLALAKRPSPGDSTQLIRAASTIVVLDRIANPDNVGGIFRNALAFGVDAVLLSTGCADPLYRKAIRTSMAAALDVPFAPVTSMAGQLEELRRAQFSILALAPDSTAATLRSRCQSLRPGRAAIVLGEEGAGLGREALNRGDEIVQIPMAPGVDSLNVAVAAGIALYELRASRAISARN